MKNQVRRPAHGYRICLLLILAGCQDATSTTPSNTADFQWYASDLHVHASGASNDTGGESWPRAIKQVAQQRGLSFIVLTDHSNSVGSDVDALAEDPALFNRGPEFAYTSQAESLTSASFLMLSGSEISPRSEDSAQPNGHIGCIPSAATVHWSGAFVDRPRGRVLGADVLAQAQTAGCFRVINHPYAFARWLAFDWTAFDYEAIEVWNGGLGYDVSDHHALGAWACDLSHGRWPTLVGGSDNHRVHVAQPGAPLDPALGTPTTWIQASALNHHSIMAGLKGHRTSVSDTGAPLVISALDENQRVLGSQGATIPLSEVSEIRLSTTLPPMDEPHVIRLYAVRPGTCVDHRTPYEIEPPEPHLLTVAERPVSAGLIEFTVPADGLTQGYIFGFVGPPGQPTSMHRNIAMSEAIHLTPF